MRIDREAFDRDLVDPRVGLDDADFARYNDAAQSAGTSKD